MSSSPLFTAESKVLIVGGGPGGLALAQILRKNGISFEIFERDDRIIPRRQGWSVGLIEALTETVPLFPDDMGDIRDVSVNSNIEADDAMTIVRPDTGEKMAVIGGRPKGQPGHIIRGDRQRLREYLSQGVNLQIGKVFSHYEEDQDGVTAFFQDGTSARGSLLVGADGANSKVRQQLMGGDKSELATPETSKWIPVFGECHLSQEQYEAYHKLSCAGILAGAEGLRYMIAPKSIAPDRSSAEFYWAACYRSSSPEEDTMWLQTASKQALFDTAVEKTQILAPFLTRIIQWTGAHGMVSPGPKFVEYVSPSSLPPGRVTILGDAAHVMLPFRGAGANTALRDSTDLAKLLVKSVHAGGSDLGTILQEYANIVLPRGREEVLSSRASGESPMGVLGALKNRPHTQRAPETPVQVGIQA